MKETKLAEMLIDEIIDTYTVMGNCKEVFILTKSLNHIMDKYELDKERLTNNSQYQKILQELILSK